MRSSCCGETLEMFLLQGRGHLPTASNSHLHPKYFLLLLVTSHMLGTN